MKTLKPSVATIWYAYTPDGVLHEGVTEPGQQTTVSDACEFEYGAGVETKAAKYKDKLKDATDKHPATPGLYKKSDKVVKLEANDCQGKKHALEAAEAKEQ